MTQEPLMESLDALLAWVPFLIGWLVALPVSAYVVLGALVLWRWVKGGGW